MRSILIAVIALFVVGLCASVAQAGPVRNVVRFVGGKAKAAAVAPLKARPLRRLLGCN